MSSVAVQEYKQLLWSQIMRPSVGASTSCSLDSGRIVLTRVLMIVLMLGAEGLLWL